MPKTQVSCPNCRQPIQADVEQLFDLNVDPTAKQKLLSGAVNFIQCPVCGYQGNLATPIVYHDPDKELLLSFVPAELGLPRDEQERLVGGLINQILNKLPQEKRKGYLLRPQSTLTMQGLVERVLEADGITREMIEAQQKKLSLIQRLANITDDDALKAVASQEDASIDAEFFSLLNRLMEVAVVSGDQESARHLNDLQRKLLLYTSFGQEVQAQSKELETAAADLRAEGRGLTRAKLLEMIQNAPNETRLQALVSMARPVMDYEFFQLLSGQIDDAAGEKKEVLEKLRAHLLELTQAVDSQIEAHVQGTRELIEQLIQTDDIEQAMAQVMPSVDEFFVQELSKMLDQTRKQGDLERSGKLQKIVSILEQASETPPELELIEEYLDAPDEQARQQFLEENEDQVTQEFIEMMANITLQAQSGENSELADHLKAANRQLLRFSMTRSMRE